MIFFFGFIPVDYQTELWEKYSVTGVLSQSRKYTWFGGFSDSFWERLFFVVEEELQSSKELGFSYVFQTC